MREIRSINPANGELVRCYRAMEPQAVAGILADAARAQRRWRQTSFAERAAVLRRTAQLLREKSDDYARLMAEEMGKPLDGGRSEAEKCAWVCEYYADGAAGFLADEVVDTDARRSYVAFEPLGLVLAVMPWNFPFWQVLRFTAPALMAGNGAVLKHAPNVSGCALAIEEVLRRAGLPPDLFRALLIDEEQVAAVIDDPAIKAVTLTGSVRAGRAVAEKAGAALKKTVLELGGSDPYLILEDADLETAAETCVASRLINSGQSCIAAKRFVAVEAVYEPFLELVVERMRGEVMGDPFDERTTVGPQAREDLRESLHRQVRRSIERGAECVLGGEIPEGPGAFYPPTVLSGVRPGMPAYDEELFGPVAAVIRVADEEEAIRVANDSPFGLGAAVFTGDDERGERIARRDLRAGSCFVNAFVKSDPRLPFGGIEQSGYGRELSPYGIKEFVNVKTVYVA